MAVRMNSPLNYCMEPEVQQSADFYAFIAWAHANRKRLITGAVVVAVVALGVWLYFLNIEQHEQAANNALASIRPTAATTGEPEIAPEAYLKVAQDYPNTQAGARALLLAAGANFTAGKFKDAQNEFEQFLQNNSSSSLVDKAQLGVAASLEAQGQIAQAATRYDDFIKHNSGNPNLAQAKSALARLYLAQNKPDAALKLYEELAQGHGLDSWSQEAPIQAEEILASHPELRPKPIASAAPAMLSSPTNAVASALSSALMSGTVQATSGTATNH